MVRQKSSIKRLVGNNRLWRLLSIFLYSAFCNGYGLDLAALNTLTQSQHTRIVWLEGGDRLTGGGALKGYDSKTNQVTQILPAEYNQNRPILCSGGHRVVVSINYKVYIVNWDGSGKTFLTDGYCSDVWIHPQTGKEWVVVRHGEMSSDGPVSRFLVDDPSTTVLLTDVEGRGAGFSSMNWLQISQDGLLSVDLMPWPTAGVISYRQPAESPNRAARAAQGCWSSMAPDNSYYWFLFSNDIDPTEHAGLAIYHNMTFVNDLWFSQISIPAGTDPTEFYHPKFSSNSAEHVVLTGGYETGSGGDPGDKVEVYLGRFNSSYSAFTGWVQVTDNTVRDFCPDVWVGVAGTNPTMELSSSSLHFEGQQGGANPAAQNVTVSAAYSSLTNVTAASNQTWLVVGQPTAAGNAYSIDNQVVMTGLSSGQHVATVTVSAANAIPSSTSYTVTLTVAGTSVATSIVITPAAANTAAGGTLQLSGSVLDQSLQPLVPQPVLTWEIAGAGDASIDATGLIQTGTALTTYTVTARYGSLMGQGHVKVQAMRPIAIVSPVGGATFAVGEQLTILWTAVPNVPGVIIEISPNLGQDWFRITPNSIARADANWGQFVWTIVPNMVSTDASLVSMVSQEVVLRIADYFDGSVQDILAQPIAILPAGAVRQHPFGTAYNSPAVFQTPSGLVFDYPGAKEYFVSIFDLNGRVVAGPVAGSGEPLSFGLASGGQKVILRLREGNRISTSLFTNTR